MTHNGQITPRHPDGTLCGHEPTASGAVSRRCPGHADHVVTCACGWEWTDRLARRALSLHRAHSVQAQGGVA